MSKTKTAEKSVSITTAILLGCLFVITIAHLFYPYRRWLWQQMQTKMNQAHRLTAQDYWQFRDRLAAGTFEPNWQYVTVREILSLKSVPIHPIPWLRFTSPAVESTDYLLPETHIPQPNYEIQMINAHTIRLKAWFPLEELYVTNGLFNFDTAEKKLLADHVWMTEATISL